MDGDPADTSSTLYHEDILAELGGLYRRASARRATADNQQVEVGHAPAPE
jgi:hypothetical protein